MSVNGTLQVVVYFLILLVTVKPVGTFMAKVFTGERTFLHPVLGWLERLTYRALGVKAEDDMKWTAYAGAMLMFSVVTLLVSYGLLRLQGYLPLNPQHYGAAQMPGHLAWNTASSFTTNTNWQSYIPEQAVSYLSNMVALAFHNWASAATGIAVAIAVVRGFSRKSANGIGSFWVDATRATLYILLPICVIGAIIFVAQGVPQNFKPYADVTTVEGVKQTIALGPVASQEIIKQLGTNGGGFFNANSSHPFENPTAFSNFFTLLLIFLIPAGLTYTFGKMVGNVRQGWSLFGAMAVLFLAGALICNTAEQVGNPNFSKLNVMQQATATQPGGNLEGKEMRFGIGASSLFATITTDASCGAVNSMHDSYTPLGGLVPIFNLLTGEVIFGGVGAGLYGMLMYAVIAVFIAGLMVGRTPEYVGKKIERFEVQMAMLAVLILAACILGFTALSANTNFATNGKPDDPNATVTITKDNEADRAKLPATATANYYQGSLYGGSDTYYGSTRNNTNNSGAHGFSEILYAFLSATGNNGSAFAGLTTNTPYYDTTMGLAMLIGRFLMIIPLLALAGSMARKKIVPMSAGTFPTDNPTFAGLLVGVVLIVGALTFFPALSLGPIVEQFQMNQGVLK
ncbi:MAG TPA: potassium-transporting ATPase subunit KdpA [Fimbriimonadaceae bacterium]|nr:potassium-transporting ATPase subunit KdpA [Fimbriimonadaceae bacterium]